ncbi:MAG: hypothetical protein U0670_11050 [Anaerolineae bacterium]
MNDLPHDLPEDPSAAETLPHTVSPSTPPPQPPPEPLPAEQARILLERAIRERCGDDWRDDDSGWLYVTGHDYMARLTKGDINLDFYVDLLGEVTITESPTNAAQNIAQRLGCVLLLLSLGIAYLMARAVGWV